MCHHRRCFCRGGGKEKKRVGMALGRITEVSLRGIAAAVPKRAVSNRDFPLLTPEERERFIQTTGVESRRVAEDGQTASDLCEAPARLLMEKLGWAPESISALIFVSQTPDYRIPATACVLQERLGLPKGCLCFDIGLGCSGYVYGLSVAASVAASLRLGRVLLLVGELTTRTVSPQDRSATPLFGDASSATALEYSPDAAPWSVGLYSDGGGQDAIKMPGGGYCGELTAEDLQLREVSAGIWRHRLHSVLDGPAIFNFSVREVPKAVGELLDFAAVPVSGVDLFVFHQANLFMNEQVRKKAGIPAERHPYSLRNFGNTSCASLPLTLVTQVREQVLGDPKKVLFCGFGVGLSWGCVLIETGEGFVCPPLLEL